MRMKKYIIICVMALAGLWLPSCTYNTYTEPSAGGDCKFHAFTKVLNASASSWQFSSGANAYFAHFDVPDITSEVYQYGVITVSREYNSGTQDAYLVLLPETTYKTAEVDNGDGTKGTVNFSQHIDYTVGIGYVEVWITISDFYYDDFTPEAIPFRLQVAY